ncbi:MAG TPA: hydroxymethylbilane synthase [Acidothermaceae bacterium]|jgi:hydroxymethylbilane synthase|nr:hydroxymethylbilane synthase [Acidothermaceae bacterium]
MTAPSVDTPTAVIRIGTRRSALAMAQATTVATALRATGSEVELVGVTTEGDRTTTALTESGGVGVFVTQLREELRAGRVDVVVHSLKDLPTAPAPDLLIAAIPMREDPRDALVARDQLTLATLPAGATVGTGSPRRVAQLRAVRPDLDIRPLRGNVDTRVGKVAAGALDAIVIAAAGLARLGRPDEATQLITVDVMAPAPGQGALAIECRAADGQPGGRLHELLTALDDPETRASVTAERGLLAALEAGCTAPVGAFAEVDAASNLHLVAVVVSVDGVTAIRGSAQGPASDAEGIGRRLAADLLSQGAGALMGTRV